MPTEPTRPVETSRKTISVLDALCERDEAGVTELAEALDMSKSTVHNHLSTLEAEGLVVRNGGGYELGLRLLEYGGHVQNRNQLFNVAAPELKDLASKSRELATLTVEEYGRSVCLACERGEQAIDLDIHPGVRRPLHLTAHGKAILAHMPRDRVDEILGEHGMEAATTRSTTDREELEEQLEAIRRRGIALDDGEYIDGLRCVAAPIKDGNGESLGAVGVSAPSSRIGSDRFRDELPEFVQSAANVIELNLNHR
jgi:DNA-binding IclR family transcriptional regulator